MVPSSLSLFSKQGDMCEWLRVDVPWEGLIGSNLLAYSTTWILLPSNTLE